MRASRALPWRTLFFLGFLGSIVASQAQAIYFQETQDTDWFNAANWSPAGVPTSGSVYLGRGYDAVIGSGTAQATSLALGFVTGPGGPGSLLVDAGSLVVSNQLQLIFTQEVLTVQNGGSVSALGCF